MFLMNLFPLVLNLCFCFAPAHFASTQSLDPSFWLLPLRIKPPLNWLTGSLAYYAFPISPLHVVLDEDTILQLPPGQRSYCNTLLLSEGTKSSSPAEVTGREQGQIPISITN